MTSWQRKKISQHKELQNKKYRPRVVPLIKKEELHKQAIKEAEEEIMEVKSELNFGGTKG